MRDKQREKGQSLLEFALVLPVLLIILAGILDLGRLYFAYVAVTDAAAEGAAYGAIEPDSNSEIKARAKDASGGQVQIDEGAVMIDSPSDPDWGDSITVTVTYSFTLATPLVNGIMPDGVIPLRARVTEVIVDPDLR